MIKTLERAKYDALKDQVSDRLYSLRTEATYRAKIAAVDAAIDIPGSTTHGRLEAYVREVMTHRDDHNLYEQLAVLRFLRYLDRYELRTKKVKEFVSFFENLPLPGSEGRTKYKMSPCQVFQFTNIMGFYYPDTPKRVTRDVLLFVPRKYGKTTVCAALAFYDALMGDKDAEAYFTANSYAQARIGFKVISKLAKLLDNGQGRFKISASTVEVKCKGQDSVIQCLANSPGRLDGLKASISITDEISQADSFDLKNVVTTSMGTRLNPLTVEITTARDKPEGPFADELGYYMQLLRREIDPTEDVEPEDGVFASIYCPDPGDDEGSPRTWRKVNPHIGYTVGLDFYEQWYRKSQRSYEDAKAFRTKLLNVFVQGDTSTWIPATDIYPLMQPLGMQEMQGELWPCTVAVDLSVSDDLSAVAYMWYREDTGRFYCHLDCYFPEEQMGRHPNAALYATWVKGGWLTLTPGKTIDYGVIADDIISNNDRIMQVAIGYDAYRSTDLINRLKAAGAEGVLRSVGQTRSNFTAPVGEMEILVDKRTIIFDANPIIPWCFGNAILDKDSNGNCKPVKVCNGSSAKIDGLIAVLMCVKLFGDLAVIGSKQEQ
jgi:phage terminase large subunit-like protein